MSCLYHIGSHCTAPRAHMHPNKTGSAGCVPPPSPPARSPPPQVVQPPLTENTVGKCPLTHWTINSNFTATLQMLITKHTILKSYPSKRTEKSRRLTHCQCQLWNPLWLGKCESVKVKAANCAKVLKTFSHTAHVAQFIPPERTAIVLLLMKFVLLPIVARGRSAFLSEVTLAKITSWSHSHPFRLISNFLFCFFVCNDMTFRSLQLIVSSPFLLPGNPGHSSEIRSLASERKAIRKRSGCHCQGVGKKRVQLLINSRQIKSFWLRTTKLCWAVVGLTPIRIAQRSGEENSHIGKENPFS